MAQLVVRQVDVEVVRALRLRAAAKGTSAEAEHREILRAALLRPSAEGNFKQTLRSMPGVGEDTDFDELRDLDRPDDLPR